ncbi:MULTISPECIES: PglY protein [unclassified Saccharopolyspora]|uniref:PglY protein n=1 Tax=unclassified Saccharopolyspora TaxID=2646250 RepID=UPI0027E00925|nr:MULTISPECIES: PglY protein [unclassified Saccharopolyspora]
MLRDVIALPESVHSGDFKVELSGGFGKAAERVEQYVVTDQLRDAFRRALSIVRAAFRDGSSHAAYLHGSFGSGKSHFLTVLHAVLNNDPTARAKPGLQPIIAENESWMSGKRFLMVPYHLVGAKDIDAALLGGYVDHVRRELPDAPLPAVYRSDAMLDDARRIRETVGDEQFAAMLGSSSQPAGAGGGAKDVKVITKGGSKKPSWDSSTLDAAFAAPQGSDERNALVSALLSGPMSSYSTNVSGDEAKFIPLDDGLSVISRHARDLGYDGLILFLDELILWLQAKMSDQGFVNEQVQKLVKLIESGNADRAVPIVSFISRQRDLSQLVGDDIAGKDVKNLEAQVHYLAERFDTVTIEDSSLPAIIKERVLKPLPGGREVLDAAFASIESTKAADRETLLDAAGATGATWDDFRAVYPISPVLLNVLVALSGALQRERTGLKLLQEMLYRRREDMKVGELIPLGDLWDVLIDNSGDAFTDRLKGEATAARRFYDKARKHIEGKYPPESADFIAADRIVKTLLLAALAPSVPALSRLTGARLNALNHGSIRTRTVSAGSKAVQILRDLQAEFGELRSEHEENPVFRLVLSDMEIEPLLDQVDEQDSLGERRKWIKRQLFRELGVGDVDDAVSDREVVWRGTRRTAEFLFANVRDENELPAAAFEPSVPGRIRIVVDYPFDDADKSPAFDAARVNQLRRDKVVAPTVVWLPHFLSTQKGQQLGRLLKIRYLLDKGRLATFAGTMSEDSRIKMRHQLQANADNLESQLVATLRGLYGIAGIDENAVSKRVGDDGHLMSLLPDHQPRPLAGAGFEQNMLAIADGLFDQLHPKHPDFDVNRNRKAVTLGELRTVYGWIAQAAENGGRVVVDSKNLALVRRIVHPLELGEVADGPLNLRSEWRRRIEQAAAQDGVTGDFPVDKIRTWISNAGFTGMDNAVMGLVIATYALQSDRAWLINGSPLAEPPVLDKIGLGHALRAQELPTADEFARARERMSSIFGATVPDTLSARNVAALAEMVRSKAQETEEALAQVRHTLDRHRDDLGIAVDADRIVSTRDASDLVARLVRAEGPTALARELVGASYGTTDVVLGSAIASAGQLASVFNTVEWQLVTSVRSLVGREAPIGNRAERLIDGLLDAASASQWTRDLGPVLQQFRGDALDLIQEAMRVDNPPQTPPQPTPTGTENPVTLQESGSGADTVSLTETGSPQAIGRIDPAPSRVSAKRVKGSAVESQLRALLDDVQDEIRAHTQAHPGVEVEINWRVVGNERDQ